VHRRPTQLRSARVGVTAVASAAALLATGTLNASPAVSAPDPSCPSPYPVSALVGGASVTGLTVTQGTTPGRFTGEVQGVLEDGIAPGVDLILADLHSPTIDRVGIWAGMSGSPVYAADGRLIGAVSYSLGYGPSTIAGITPAADMAKLGGTPTASTVRVPASLARRLVGNRVATTGEVAQGLTGLRTPYTVSGLSSARMAKVARVLRLGGGQVAAGTAGPTSAEQIPITAGGTMAASLSYGTVTAAGVGTATTVCGREVTGFGHPMSFTGASRLTLHGARTVLIQDDSLGSGFKVANLGAPVGSVDQDRMAGLHATTGATPSTSTLAATASDGARRGVGTTHVSVPEEVVGLGFSHLIAVQDKAMDRMGKGIATTRWTISGTRANGAPFSFTRSNRYADPYDISAATAIALAGDLSAIQDNPDEAVEVGAVRVRSHVADVHQAYAIARVQALVHGRWLTAARNEPLPLRAGYPNRLRILLTSRDAAPRTLQVKVAVPPRTLNRLGALHVVGGNVTEDSEEFFFEEEDAFESLPAPSTASFPALLTRLRHQQRNDEVVATVQFRRAPGTSRAPRTATVRTNRVVSGNLAFPVYGVR
jgi:hypothetical protein